MNKPFRSQRICQEQLHISKDRRTGKHCPSRYRPRAQLSRPGAQSAWGGPLISRWKDSRLSPGLRPSPQDHTVLFLLGAQYIPCTLSQRKMTLLERKAWTAGSGEAKQLPSQSDWAVRVSAGNGGALPRPLGSDTARTARETRV